MKMDTLRREDQILGGLAVLLVIDLLFLPWFSFSFGPLSADSTATGAPDGWLGLLAVLATLALIADIAVAHFSPQTTVPMLGGSRGMTRFILAAAAAGFIVLKFLFHIHFSLFGIGFWGAVVLVAATVFVARQRRAGDVATPREAPLV